MDRSRFGGKTRSVADFFFRISSSGVYDCPFTSANPHAAFRLQQQSAIETVDLLSLCLFRSHEPSFDQQLSLGGTLHCTAVPLFPSTTATLTPHLPGGVSVSWVTQHQDYRAVDSCLRAVAAAPCSGRFKALLHTTVPCDRHGLALPSSEPRTHLSWARDTEPGASEQDVAGAAFVDVLPPSPPEGTAWPVPPEGGSFLCAKVHCLLAAAGPAIDEYAAKSILHLITRGLLTALCSMACLRVRSAGAAPSLCGVCPERRWSMGFKALAPYPLFVPPSTRAGAADVYSALLRPRTEPDCSAGRAESPGFVGLLLERGSAWKRSRLPCHSPVQCNFTMQQRATHLALQHINGISFQPDQRQSPACWHQLAR